MTAPLCPRGCGRPDGLHACPNVPPVPAGIGPLYRSALARAEASDLAAHRATSQALLLAADVARDATDKDAAEQALRVLAAVAIEKEAGP